MDNSIMGSPYSALNSGYYGQNQSWLRNAYVSPERRKLNEAREFLKTHPHNPGVLDRWLLARKSNKEG